jgi:hypothetical protein
MFVSSLLHPVYFSSLLLKTKARTIMFVPSTSAQISISLEQISQRYRTTLLSIWSLKIEVLRGYVCAVCFSPKYAAERFDGRLLALSNSKDHKGIFFCHILFFKISTGLSNVCLSLLKITSQSLNVQIQQRNDRCLFSLPLLKIRYFLCVQNKESFDRCFLCPSLV